MAKDETIIPKYPMVLVIWVDIVQGELGWRSLDEMNEWSDEQDGIVHQVGFLTDKTEDYITLIDCYFKSDETVGTPHKIPMGVVQEIIYLK